MSNTKHTPVPYEAELVRWSKDAPVAGFSITHKGRTICTLHTHANTLVMNQATIEEWKIDRNKVFTDEEAEANASFIVKACNNHDKLVEAVIRLKSRIKFLEQYTEGKVDPTILTEIDELLESLKD
jgi:hypothetical protein